MPHPSISRKLYRSVFSSGSGVLTPADVKALPEPLRGRLDKYLTRRGAWRALQVGADSFEQVRVDAKRRLLEQAIVSLIDAPGIRRAPPTTWPPAPHPLREWKGLQDGPRLKRVPLTPRPS